MEEEKMTQVFTVRDGKRYAGYLATHDDGHTLTEYSVGVVGNDKKDGFNINVDDSWEVEHLAKTLIELGNTILKITGDEGYYNE